LHETIGEVGLYRWGPFELDEHRLEIRRDGVRIVVPPRIFQLVLFLIEHRTRAVSNAELHARLWPGIAVSGASLATAVKEARRLLGDDGRSQRYILTVRGRGYCWNEPVEEIALPLPVPDPDASFVGRQRELAVLSRLLEDAVAGRGQLALITGDAGIGKTRLVAELARPARGNVLPVASTRCDRLEGTPAFQPWRDLLATVAQRHPELTPPVLLRDEIAASWITEAADPGVRRFQLFDDTLRFLWRASEAGAGWMLWFDDLHAADLDSLALVAALARELAGRRLLVVGTWREPELSLHDPRQSLRRSLLHEPAVVVVHVHGLALEDTVKLVERLAPEGSLEFASALHHEARGNPFFVEEVIRGIDAQGISGLLTAEQAHRVRPEGLQEILRARLARRGPVCVSLLEAACVLGHELSPRIAEIVAGVPGELALGAWDEAEAAGLIRSVEGAHPRVAFAHALLRETVAQGMGRPRRAALHLRTAEVLEAHGTLSDPDVIVQLAYHYRGAGPLASGDQAAHYARIAAAHAIERFAFSDAARHLRDALELGAEGKPPRERAELFVELGAAQFNAGDIAASRQSYLEAARLLRAAFEPEASELFVRATLGLGRGLEVLIQPFDDDELTAHLREALEIAQPAAASQRSLVMARLAIALQGVTLNPEGARVAAEAFAMAEDANDLDAQVYAQLARFWATKHPSLARETLGCSQQLARLAERSSNGYWASWALLFHAASLVEHGRIDEARQLAVRQASHIERAQHPAARAPGQDLACLLATIAWQPAEAEAALSAAHALNSGLGDALLAELISIVAKFVVLSQSGRSAELVPLLHGALAAYPYPPARALLAAAQWRAGGLDAARGQYDLARDEVAASSPGRFFTMNTVLSDLVVAFDDVEAAVQLEALLLQVDAPHVTIGAAYFGPVARHLALCAAVQRRCTDAEELLARAAAQSEAIGARWWSDQILRDRRTLAGLSRGQTRRR
jgi:DNA-binding winged helix-turn-helix (wHTH) protein